MLITLDRVSRAPVRMPRFLQACWYEAPSMEALLEATRRGGFPVAPDAITQVLESGVPLEERLGKGTLSRK